MSADSQNVTYDAEQLKQDAQLMALLKSINLTTFNGSQIVKVGNTNCRVSLIGSLGVWEFVFFKAKSNVESDAVKTVTVSTEDVDSIFDEDDNGILRL